MAPLTDTLKGSLLMMGAMAGFVFNDALMRVVLESLPLYQAIFLRGVVLTPLLGILAWRRGALFFRASPIDRWRMRLRSGSEVVGTFLFLTALSLLPFANISAIMQAIPLAVTLGAAVVLGAPIGWRRVSAILVGFAGVLIVVRPGTDGFSYGSLLVLMVVGIVVVRDLTSRVLSPSIPSVTVALHAAVILTICNGVLALSATWAAVPVEVWGYLIGAAIFLTGGYICSVATMRIGDIATIAPFRYTALLWSILIGYLFFNEIPDIWTLVGSAIIVAMGVFSFYRERQLARV